MCNLPCQVKASKQITQKLTTHINATSKVLKKMEYIQIHIFKLNIAMFSKKTGHHSHSGFIPCMSEIHSYKIYQFDNEKKEKHTTLSIDAEKALGSNKKRKAGFPNDRSK